MGFELSPEERRCLAALVDCLIPADDVGPGAVEAGVVDFIAGQLRGPYGEGLSWYRDAAAEAAGDLPPAALYRRGLHGLDELARRLHGAAFDAIAPEARGELVSAIEAKAHEAALPGLKLFFEQVLTNTVEGYFGDPVHGGNKDAASWAMIGFPGCGQDYSTLIETHRDRPITLPIRTIAGLLASGA